MCLGYQQTVHQSPGESQRGTREPVAKTESSTLWEKKTKTKKTPWFGGFVSCSLYFVYPNVSSLRKDVCKLSIVNRCFLQSPRGGGNIYSSMAAMTAKIFAKFLQELSDEPHKDSNITRL